MMNKKLICGAILLCLFVQTVFVISEVDARRRGKDSASQELTYPSKAFSKLDTFEAVTLEDADKLFLKKDYRGAYVAYGVYETDFPKGKALPYALFRKGRCLHLLGKRNSAIKAYQDVVDYFPNEISYAAAALYYIGQCHAQNGNNDKSLAAWAKLAKDKAYASQPRSGSALTALAVAMDKRGKHEEATQYRWRTAVAFRNSNVKASKSAQNSVIHHYVLRSPNIQKLIAFCKEYGAYGNKPEEHKDFWRQIINRVNSAKANAEKTSQVALYWNGKFGNRFKTDDSMRIALFNMQLIFEKDQNKWMEKVDAQFRSKPATLDRVFQWIGYYRDSKKRQDFFTQHGQPLIAGLDNKARISLMKRLRKSNLNEQAHSVLRSVRIGGMSDAALLDLANFATGFEGEEGFLRYLNKIQDPTFAAKARFDFYFKAAGKNADFQEKALKEIATLRKSPKYAQAIVWNHAELLKMMGRFDEAIKQYQAANRQPDSTWAIITCHLAEKRYGKAIRLASELESLGGATAARACLKAADIYRMSGQKGKEVQQLQVLLRRYPKSKESSTAHGRLENYGVKLVGGEATAEE